MRRTLFPHVSSGERSFVYAMLGTSILGAMLACVTVTGLSDATADSGTATAITYWTIFAGCIGGAGGLWACYERWFGHAGTSGWMTALIGALMVSGLGSVICGTLILPFYGTMFGPLQLIVVMVENPMLGVIWLGMMVCAHGLLTQWRRERDSIFINGYYAPK